MSNEKTGCYFEPLGQAAFLSLEYSAFLKGLLKPFKGKGELESWANQCERLRDGVIHLAQEKLLRQAQSFPFALLSTRYALQSTGTGTSFLRWRNADRSLMGVHLWQKMMAAPQTPQHLIDDLYQMEVQRAVVNMQISILHTIAKQARDCAKKVDAAQAHYLKRCSS
ncbi:hypothetical protein CUZ56_01386 [Saezia sanguinis]|uniref:Integrase regulator R n=1 Tax=Saezia sanguinis TaxID=1965230 RepID=A0A433SFB6_9BURK|nr:DUF3158 family protein [Saezia sanguinis]RUS67441.1 hypothetical protein CUZ56_01386 [Saezia sanguinis]